MRPQQLIACTLMISALAFSGCNSVTAESTKSAAKADGSETVTDAKVSAKLHEQVSEPSTPIDIVKNGMLAGYDSTTVGKAFDGTFQEPKWSTFETPKGQTIVQFNGTIKMSLMKKADFDPDHSCPGGYSDQSCDVPIQFQFMLSADKKTFSLSYFDTRTFQRNSHVSGGGMIPGRMQEALDFIYM